MVDELSGPSPSRSLLGVLPVEVGLGVVSEHQGGSEAEMGAKEGSTEAPTPSAEVRAGKGDLTS